MFEREDVIWAAGLFEGEGWVGASVQRTRNGHVQLQLGLLMSDLDVVERWAAVFGWPHRVRAVAPRPKPDVHATKPLWAVYIGGHERAQAALVAMYPWLGERRKAAALKALALKNKKEVMP